MTFKERLGDRRTDLRFEIIGQLWGALEAIDYLPLKNLARGGALVEAQTPVGAESFRALRFGFNGTTQEVAVRVRHVTTQKTPEGDRYLVGLEFVEPSAAALDQIDRIIEARLAEMKPVSEA
jgi:PilZ domain